MNVLKSALVSVLLSSMASFAVAANNPLSVHVLNLQNGTPSSQVAVTLEKQNSQGWQMINNGVTNEEGRITALYPEGKELETGTYRVTFKTGDWFKEHNMKTFFPTVPVIFEVDGAVAHYHIPLLISPYGFSTYRGN